MSDIDTAAVDSLKVLDPKRPIREVTHLGREDPCRPLAQGAYSCETISSSNVPIKITG